MTFNHSDAVNGDLWVLRRDTKEKSDLHRSLTQISFLISHWYDHGCSGVDTCFLFQLVITVKSSIVCLCCSQTDSFLGVKLLHKHWWIYPKPKKSHPVHITTLAYIISQFLLNYKLCGKSFAYQRKTKVVLLHCLTCCPQRLYFLSKGQGLKTEADNCLRLIIVWLDLLRNLHFRWNI